MIGPWEFFDTSDRFYERFLKTDEATAVNYARLYNARTGFLGRIIMNRSGAKFKAAREFLVDFCNYSSKDLRTKLRGARK